MSPIRAAVPVFTQKIRSAGLLFSFGTVGDGLDNAMMESIWSTMQIELLNRKKWKTRIELANKIFEHIEVFYSRRRRHFSVKYAKPHDYDLAPTLRALTNTGSQWPRVEAKL